jgi:hypothetical protein
MATITPVVINNSDQTWYVQWLAMGNADTGSGTEFGQYPDRTIGVYGTFGGATVTIQGSMDNSTWSTLNDYKGNALTYTAAGISLIAENPLYIRAITSGGSGSSINVIILGSRA